MLSKFGLAEKPSKGPQMAINVLVRCLFRDSMLRCVGAAGTGGCYQARGMREGKPATRVRILRAHFKKVDAGGSTDLRSDPLLLVQLLKADFWQCTFGCGKVY